MKRYTEVTKEQLINKSDEEIKALAYLEMAHEGVNLDDEDTLSNIIRKIKASQSEAKAHSNRYVDIEDVFKRYLVIAEGNITIAKDFFSKAYKNHKNYKDLKEHIYKNTEKIKNSTKEK